MRFGPELSALKELLATSQQGYRQQTHAASAGAAAIQAAAATGLQQLKGVYADSPTYGIPGLSRQQALNDMIGRGVSAQEGAVGQRRLALQNLRADEAKILSRQSDIGQEVGAFQASEVGRLSQQQADRELRNRISLRSQSQSERNSLRSSGINPDTGQPIPGGKLDPNRPGGPRRRKPATPAAHESAVAHIGAALAALRTLDPDRIRANRPHVGGLLVSGSKAQRLIDPATGKAKVSRGGVPLTTPNVPAVPQPFATAALDTYYDGHLSRRTQQHLQSLGYSIRELRLPTYGQWRRSHPPAPPYSRPGPRTY